jgi:hypothetical protein
MRYVQRFISGISRSYSAVLISCAIALVELTFGGLCDRFIEEEHLREINNHNAGQLNTFGTLQASTARSCLQLIDPNNCCENGTIL